MASWVSKRATKSARRISLLALLGVLAAGFGAYVAFAAAVPAAPALAESPSVSPTNSASETFSFSSSGATSYQCSFNGVAFAACTSPKTYGSPAALADGSYSFQVRYLTNKGVASNAASYAWMVDRTAPTVSSINRSTATPSNAASVAWTVTFSEPVNNVAATNFSLAKSGLGGSPAITGVSGSGSVYTVTASTGSGDGSLGLNLSTKPTISDPAGNALGGSVPVVGQAYTLDRTPPPAPTLGTPRPASPTNQTTASLSFSDTEAGVSFQCKLDAGSYAACANPASYSGLGDGSHTFLVAAQDAAGNLSATAASYTWTVDATPPPRPTVLGPNNKSDSSAATFTFSDAESNVTFSCSMDLTGWSPCTSPKTYFNLSSGTHEFDVRATGTAGNTGDYNGWKWTINPLGGGGQPFKISGNASSTLYPGGATASISLQLTNPNSVTIYINNLTVSMLPITAPQASTTHTCTAADFSLTQYTGTYPLVLAAGATMTLSSQLPTIRMLDRPLNQDGCKTATLNFSYSGSAQS